MTMPRLAGLATAVPPHVLAQEEVATRAAQVFAQRPALFERLRAAYGHAGISARRSCVPIEWYLQPHRWVERSRLYVDNALDLLESVASETLRRARLPAEAVDALMVISSTGIATPSLDARLMERMAFRRDVARLPVFGLGCAGGALGLARAAALARGMAPARVLCLVVELCGLTFRAGDQSKSNIIAAALFGDGAAGALVSTHADDSGPELGPSGEHTWPDSLDVMGWRVEEDGLGVQFSRDIPDLVRREMRPVADAFLARHGLARQAIGRFVCHPGGAKVLDALEEAFELPAGGLVESRAVLDAFGNMSAPTVLFALERALATPAPGRLMVSALGPGFTAAFQLLSVP